MHTKDCGIRMNNNNYTCVCVCVWNVSQPAAMRFRLLVSFPPSARSPPLACRKLFSSNVMMMWETMHDNFCVCVCKVQFEAVELRWNSHSDSASIMWLNSLWNGQPTNQASEKIYFYFHRGHQFDVSHVCLCCGVVCCMRRAFNDFLSTAGR